MVKIICINKNSARHNQQIGDIICIYDDEHELSADEKICFDVIPVEKLKKDAIQAELNKKLVAGETYPKFPFNTTSLTETDKVTLASTVSTSTSKLAAVDKVTLKAPVVVQVMEK